MGEAARRKARGEYPRKTYEQRAEAHWKTQHSMQAVMALLRDTRRKKDDEGERRPQTRRESRHAKVRRAMAKASRRRNRK